MKISVVMPVYNEIRTVEEAVRRVQAAPYEKEIILVDDGSTDGTSEVLRKISQAPNVKLLYHSENKGKGAALHTGFKACEGEYIIVQDADLEYSPKDYPWLLEPLIDGRADVVYGSRFLGGPHRVLFFWHYIGNKFLTLLCNVFSNLNLSDMETCYKVFRRSILGQLHLQSKRFGFEPEFTIKIGRLKLRVYEVPVSYAGRDYSEGKKITWKDGIAAIFTIFRYALMD